MVCHSPTLTKTMSSNRTVPCRNSGLDSSNIKFFLAFFLDASEAFFGALRFRFLSCFNSAFVSGRGVVCYSSAFATGREVVCFSAIL